MSQRQRVLVTAPYFQGVVDRYRPLFESHGIELVVPHVVERLGERELLPLVSDIVGALCGDDTFTAKILDNAPRLRVISKWGTGIDSIDVAACERRGIAVRNTPNAFSEPVADSVLGYVLCFARQLPWLDRELRSSGWAKLPSVSLRESTVGIIGVGNVGRAVARRVAGFGARLLGNDIRSIPEEFLRSVSMTMVARDELLELSDFVSLNCDLNPTSFHLLSDPGFARMKPTGILINTARGSVVDEAALVRALQRRTIAGAALDVFEIEPLPEVSPLRTMTNVLLASHNSNVSPEAWERVHESTVRNLLEALEDCEP